MKLSFPSTAEQHDEPEESQESVDDQESVELELKDDDDEGQEEDTYSTGLHEADKGILQFRARVRV